MQTRNPVTMEFVYLKRNCSGTAEMRRADVPTRHAVKAAEECERKEDSCLVPSADSHPGVLDRCYRSLFDRLKQLDEYPTA